MNHLKDSLPASNGWVENLCTDRNAGKTVFLFIVLHIVVWTVFTGISRHEFDSDAMMHFAWSQEWRMSYALHPPFLPWLIGAWLNLTGIGKWQYLLLSQVNIAVAFVAVWFLAREFLTPSRALFAVVLLEFIPYYSFLSLRFNHSSLLIPVWAITMLVAHYCLTRKGLRYWIALGVCAAIAMLTKYYSVALLAAVGLLFLITPAGREQWRHSGPWIAIVVFVMGMSGHVIYVLNEDQPTISHINDYFFFFSLEHRWPAIKFLLAQILYFLPALLVFWLCNRTVGFGTSIRNMLRAPILSAPLFPVWFMTAFPLLVTAIPGFLLGVDISSRWGAPVLVLSTLLLVYCSQEKVDIKHGSRTVITATTYLVALPAIVLTLILAGVMKTTRNSFPGPELGLAITERWHQQLGIPLQIVGGGFVTADTIAFYSTDNPSSFQHMSRVWSPWITLDRIRSQGIAMVCLHDDIECQGDAMRVFPMHEFEVLEIEGRKKLFSEVSSQRVYYMFVPPGEAEIYLNRAAHTGIDK